ncbi:MAG TPA: KTSC domain-containing protein [Steroidobacteraceae bacterium]|nr:KTSC domain-containing protein [Steroidobacteraceae bacterium]
MTRLPVQSSNLASIGYHDGVLHIEFSSGTVYEYRDVPVELYEAFVDAPSVGKFYAAFIRGKFPSTKLEPEKESHAETREA